MSNWTKESILEYLENDAPNTKLVRAMSLARDFQILKESEFYYREMLAILSTLVLDEHGKIKPEHQNHRPAIIQALKCAQTCQAWVVCGPVTDGMEKLMCEIEKDKK